MLIVELNKYIGGWRRGGWLVVRKYFAVFDRITRNYWYLYRILQIIFLRLKRWMYVTTLVTILSAMYTSSSRRRRTRRRPSTTWTTGGLEVDPSMLNSRRSQTSVRPAAVSMRLANAQGTVTLSLLILFTSFLYCPFYSYCPITIAIAIVVALACSIWSNREK